MMREVMWENDMNWVTLHNGKVELGTFLKYGNSEFVDLNAGEARALSQALLAAAERLEAGK